MITITLCGMDIYQAIPLTKKLHQELVKIYNIPDNELNFIATESFVIHDGIEQTSFLLDIKVEASEEFDYEELENKVKDTILACLENVAIHFHITFSYFQPQHEYTIFNENYPSYMSETNTIKVEEEHDEDYDEDSDDEEEYQEPYMGDIIGEFDQYVKEHPDASNQEIYEALMGIRDEVTAKHHNHGNNNDEEEE